MMDGAPLAEPATAAGGRLLPPIGLLAELTHRCPLQCPYCSNPVDLARRSAELTTAEWVDVFAQAAALGVLQVHLSGGEPTARADLVEIVAGARAAGLYTNLITAGVLLDGGALNRLVAAGLDHVQLSIQDVDPEGAEAISNYRGGLQKKLDVARLVRARGLPLTLNCVVHRRNLDRVDRMLDLALALDAHRIEIASVQYYGWALANRAQLMPTREQVDRATEVVEQARVRLKGRLVIDYVVPDYFAVRPKKCMDGWASQYFAVTPRGNVLPCHAAETITGMSFANVRDRRLADVWRDDPAFNRFRGTDWMPEPCRSCPFKHDDLGGCRCQAFAITGDASATDPACHQSDHHAVMLAATESPSDSEASAGFTYRR